VSERDNILASLVHTIHDYRAGEISAPTAEHLSQWVDQFESRVQLPMLREMDHVLKKTYFSREKVTEFLKSVMTDGTLVGKEPCSYWKNVRFLNIQKAGNSQSDFLALFDELLQEECGFGIECSRTVDSRVFIYLDDAIFGGSRVRDDLKGWIKDAAPNMLELHVIAMVIHRSGQYYTECELKKASFDAEKAITIKWKSGTEMEDRKSYKDTSDVLWPAAIPDDRFVQDYASSLQYRPTLRVRGKAGTNQLFSSEEGRNALEQVFLTAGARIRLNSQNFTTYHRPLGFSKLSTFGFGSLIVTFRNCPNTAPLALWADGAWKPLFPRVTNRTAATRRNR